MGVDAHRSLALRPVPARAEERGSTKEVEKLSEGGDLTEVIKDRVTTDDTAELEESGVSPASSRITTRCRVTTGQRRSCPGQRRSPRLSR